MTNGNWPHQDRIKASVARHRGAGAKSCLLVAPCGAGKSRIMAQETVEEVERGGRVHIYLHRTMLFEQLSSVFASMGIEHGYMASGYPVDESKPVQLCMTDSVFARAIQSQKWDIGYPTLAVFDEAHNQVGNKAKAIAYGAQIDGETTPTYGLADRGAFILGASATPVNCGEFYQTMVHEVSFRELRDIKAHLPIRVFAPSEIDCEGLSQNAENEYSEREIDKRSRAIIGDAYEWWKKLNPAAEPAILFGPSVDGSKWFAEQWTAKGVRVAHLDGEVCLLPRKLECGKLVLDQYDTTTEIREEIMRMSRSGEIALVCNRFVLREAIDMPWLRHGIAATVFGGLATYLQSVGRIQRYHPDYEWKIFQDHGGSFHRHGSPNMERVWKLGDTNKTLAKARRLSIQESGNPADIEGVCCPKCKCYRRGGTRCPHCGHVHKKSVRSIQMLDGTLHLQTGVVNKPKKKKSKTADSIWLGVLFGSAKVDRSVSSAVSIWRARCNEAGIVPSPSTLTHKPPDQSSLDWHKSVKEVYPWVKPKGSNK